MNASSAPASDGAIRFNAAGAPEHSNAFRLRRFANWFPLGLTYATYYMGRYNLNVSKGAIGAAFHLDKAQVGTIATAGFWTYAAAVAFNGPLADRIGGKKAILVGAAGAAAINLLIGLLFAGHIGVWERNLVLAMSVLYAANCYFQSFGALSVVKVNSTWFHVRERGVFGGIFGSMISSGYALALSVGGVILASALTPGTWLSNLGLGAVFIVPAFAIAAMAIVDTFLVRDSPKTAGHTDFDVGDASSGDDEAPVDLKYLFAKVLQNRIILTLAAAEFCTGFVRQGLLLYFVEYLSEVHKVKLGSSLFTLATLGPTIGGICGGILCGWLSDRFFDSRRPPVAFLFYLGQIATLIALRFAPSGPVAAALIGLCCAWVFGVHGMLSGTAAMDFGGRKAAATTAGMLDGVQYFASGFTGFLLGWVIQHQGWSWWTPSLIPFSILGGIAVATLWNEKPRRAAAH